MARSAITFPAGACLAALVLSAVVLGGCEKEKERDAGEVVVAEALAYRDGEVELEGYLAYDKSRAGKRPGILVIHEWWGLGPHPKERARRLAALGYVAFCADMYGKGKLTDEVPQAQAWSRAFYEDRSGFGRRRLGAGYRVLAGHERVDARRIGVMGFCFGGTVALEAAWAGLDAKAVVSFHGSLTTPSEEDVDGVKSSILVCHGADDGFVSEEQVSDFETSMKDGGFDWLLVKYGNAVHSFTNRGADARAIPGVAYEARADARSWAHMQAFFAERLAP